MDGSFCMFQLSESAALTRKEVPFSEEVLVTRGDLEDKEGILADMQAVMSEKATEYELDLVNQKKNLESQLKDLERAYEQVCPLFWLLRCCTLRARECSVRAEFSLSGGGRVNVEHLLTCFVAILAHF